jgi:type IV pilus assembly protein PilC
MVSYAYKGIDGKGARIEGQIQATNLEEAERKLSMQDVSILTLKAASGGKSKAAVEATPKPKGGRRLKKIPAQDTAAILRNLAVMAETGVPFVEAIDAVIGSARTPAIEHSLSEVKDAILAGQGLSNALRAAPNMFPAIIVDMIKVAETGGRLDQALANGATYMERAAELRRKIMNAMMYPMVMLGVSILTILILVIVVMPKFANVFSQMKADLPATTKLMLSFGNFVRGNPVMGVVGAAVTVGVIYFLSQLPVIQRAVAMILYRLPIVGDLIKRLALARALQSIATLSASNVPLLAAIENGAKVANHYLISKSLMDARDQIEHGRSMSEALTETKVFPKQITQMVAVGERTGRLPQLLSAICDSMEGEVDGKLKALVSIIEPLMIVTMGVIVGSITMSIIGPIYSVVEKIR